MRPEDRKPSKRVFPLLQNLDLDTVTFAQVQGTGNPITIEDMNEQEMLDLIIVNLARLCVAGEWSGLLEAGGSATMNAVLADASTINSGYPINRIDSTAPWSTGLANNGTASRNEPQWAPFVAAASGDITAITIDVQSVASSAVNFLVAIYSDDDGLPAEKLTSAVFDAEVDGLTTQTSLTGTATLVSGTQYWYGYVRSASTSFTMTSGDSTPPYMGPTATLTASWGVFWYPSASANALPATVTKTTLEPRGNARPSVGITI